MAAAQCISEPGEPMKEGGGQWETAISSAAGITKEKSSLAAPLLGQQRTYFMLTLTSTSSNELQAVVWLSKPILDEHGQFPIMLLSY